MLKEVIDKSEILVNNIKTIKAKINEKLNGIGGKGINNYSELPASLQNAVKNNLKTMAVVSINSKVGSTGGGIDYKELTYTRINNYSELPASLQNAVKNNLKTMAVVSINSKVGSTGGGIDYKELTYTRHINFTPYRVFVRYKIIYTPIRGGGDWGNRDDNKILYIDSAYHNSQDMGGYISVNKIYVKSFTKDKIVLGYRIHKNRDDNKILYIDSAYHNSQDMGGYISVNKIYVKSFTKDKIVLGYRIHNDYYGNRELQIIDAIYIK